MQRYWVKLSAEERQELKTLVSCGRAAAYQQTHGRVLLLSDEAHADGAMKDAKPLPGFCRLAVRRWNGCAGAAWRKGLRRRWDESGRLTGGRSGWTLKLLADRLVEGEIVESISPETVRQTLKKTNSSPG